MERLGCSIDMEPRTLHEGELLNAREAAIDIIQSKEADEASDIFTEGMGTVVSIREAEKEIERNNQLQKLLEDTEKTNRSWDLLPCVPGTSEESPDITKIREPLSSPF